MPALLLGVAVLLVAIVARLLLRRHAPRGALIDFLQKDDPAARRLLREPRERDVTILRTNLDDMSRTFADLGDRRAADLLNQFFNIVVPIVRQYDGCILQREFDKLFIVFGPMLPGQIPGEQTHAASALHALLEMQRAVADLNKTLSARELPPVTMRAGVATGMVHLGDVGTADATFFTAIGDNANLARHLESAARTADAANLVSAETHARTRHLFTFRPISDTAFEILATSEKL